MGCSHRVGHMKYGTFLCLSSTFSLSVFLSFSVSLFLSVCRLSLSLSFSLNHAPSCTPRGASYTFQERRWALQEETRGKEQRGKYGMSMTHTSYSYMDIWQPPPTHTKTLYGNKGTSLFCPLSLSFSVRLLFAGPSHSSAIEFNNHPDNH